MSKEMQIEEIKRDIFAAFGGYEKWEEDWQSLAEAVYNAGYRKQKEVAREIFEEIERLTPKKFTEKSQDFEFGYALAIQQIKNKIAELKKKYTENENG